MTQRFGGVAVSKTYKNHFGRPLEIEASIVSNESGPIQAVCAFEAVKAYPE